MKLRIRGNSLRLRLSQSDVSKIGNGGAIEETLDFGGEPPQRLIYALVPVNDVEKLTAVFDAGRITVFLPKSEADKWVQTTQIGIEATKSIGSNRRPLSILIEKDFACLEPRTGDEDSDTFANPLSDGLPNKIETEALD